MTVAFDASTKSPTWTTTPNPFTFTHTPVGTVKGVVLQIAHGTTSADRITGSVLYGGVVMTRIDTAWVVGEHGRVYTYFLGAGIPQGAQTVSIGHSATSGVKIGICTTLTATSDTEIVTFGKLEQADRLDPKIALDAGATSALRFCIIYSGLDAVTDLALLTGITAVHSHDYGAFVTRSDRQTTASTGSFDIGYVAALDDVAMSAVAVQETAAQPSPTFNYPISGDVGPLTIAAEETGHIVGDVNLLGDITVEGTLTGIDTFIVEGNDLWQILVQHGGVVALAGVEKTAWTNWDGTVVGWTTGDRLAVAPTAVGIYTPTEITWGGSWAATTRPANSPNHTLPAPDSRVMKPEVLNLSQTITLQNMRRGFHFHDGAGVQSLKWLRIVNSGVAGVVGDYSLHFHLNGLASSGSLVEGVVIEGSLNHAFVPHGSHGITMKNCAAYRAAEGAFWWDPPPDIDKRSPINNSNDTIWDHNLALHVLGVSITAEGFSLGAGLRNVFKNCAASCTAGGKSASGVHWPGHASQNRGGNVWESHDNVVHNQRNNAVFIWQNGASPLAGDDHLNEDWVMYNCGRSGWNHGAYNNNYEQRRFVIQNVGEHAIAMHAIGGIKHTDVLTNGSLIITIHNINDARWVELLRCTFTKVVYNSNENQGFPSFTKWTDCTKYGAGNLDMADFVSYPTLVPIATTPGGIHPSSKIEIWRAGVLYKTWANGAWT